jgi:hypothetical protein
MSGDIEDEKHFILHCRAYQDLRDTLIKDIQLLTTNRVQLEQDPELQWKVLMQATGDNAGRKICEALKTFIREAHKRRNSI